MEIKEISWQQTMPVRHKVLWPDKPIAHCQVPGDENGWHFGVYEEDALVCVASVYAKDNSARLRKFAALPERQGNGIGSMLLKHIIERLKEKGVTHFWCDARESAQGFYQRFGFVRESEIFYKSEVPYYKMGVNLEIDNG